MQAVDTERLPQAYRGVGLYSLGLIISLFFLWGVANNLNDILIKQFKKAFTLTDLEAGLVQSAFYAGYFLLAIPASLCMRRFGYKAALVTGLCLYATGAFLFYPAAQWRTYGMFLGALFVIASGLAFLETAANPLVTLLGSPERAALRLNLAQSFNPLGSITGVLVGQHFIFSGTELSASQLDALTQAERSSYMASQSLAVRGPYLLIGVVVLIWAVLIATIRLPPAASDRSGAGQLRRLLRDGHFLSSVAVQFFYVGAQVGVWSFLIRYAQEVIPGMSERHAADFLNVGLLIFMAGRFAGTASMRFASPARLLTVFALCAACLAGVAVALPGRVGLYALVATSFFMSIMFPTIFALGLRDLDADERKIGASLLVMAIIGGAVLPALMGGISDEAGIHTAMIVPAVAFLSVFGFAWLSRARNE